MEGEESHLHSERSELLGLGPWWRRLLGADRVGQVQWSTCGKGEVKEKTVYIESRGLNLVKLENT